MTIRCWHWSEIKQTLFLPCLFTKQRDVAVVISLHCFVPHMSYYIGADFGFYRWAVAGVVDKFREPVERPSYLP
jgi:hypothetical protein